MQKMTINKKILLGGAITFILLLMSKKMSATKIITKWEGKKLKAYKDLGGKWTIGYGSTYNYDEDRFVKESDVISEETALEWLKIAEDKIRTYLNKVVKVFLNDNQKNALVSFIYNIGQGNFSGSTLLKKLNAGKSKEDVALEFHKWNKVKINGKFEISKGLINRRNEEAALFLK